MPMALTLLIATGYVLLARFVLRSQSGHRDALFAALNVSAVYLLFFLHMEAHHGLLYAAPFVGYLGIVLVQYLALRCWGQGAGVRPWLAFFVPIGFLITVRYAPLVRVVRTINRPLGDLMQHNPQLSPGVVLVGLSYLAFRSSYLVLEVRNGVVACPNLWQYVGFAFFPPTMSVGPINRYATHRGAFDAVHRPNIPVTTAALRVLVGAVKYGFLGPILNQFTYSGLVRDGHPHHWIDLPIAAVSYYLYLYCNFSGFCDIAIGSAGLIGVTVTENFASPFAARNVKEFWNRWHITLSEYMREVVFSPLARALVRIFGASRANHAIAATIFVVFLLVGVWHGVGWHYATFGVSQGVAVVANHYYTLTLKKQLGKDRFAAYGRNPTIHALAVTMTFLYTAGTIFVFANDWTAIKAISSALQAS
jgi:D-alanyl-lipoteichoic acid acyltransferase DltB (MBOAT superfamily)